MTVPMPEIGEADILVAVRAASVNGFDVYQAAPRPDPGVYSIDRAGDAFQAFQQGTRGKLVLSVGSDGG